MPSGAFARLVEKSKFVPARKPVVVLAFLFAVSFATVTLGQHSPQDPGVRGGTVNSGQPLSSVSQTPGGPDFFANGLLRFQNVESVQGGANNGLGPRFNSNQCSSCHSQPAIGGSSPSATVFPNVGPNPETLVYSLDGAQNTLPSFITPNGPVREARFKFFLNSNGTSLSSTPDGGVHDLFVISGRGDAGNCNIKQPNFAQHLALNNVIYRIPTPTFGAGLIENIPEETIYANMQANSRQKQSLGISGQVNRDGNDGMITRFGWKAQNKSLEVFAGEAYNVEMGVTNELFENERSSPDEALAGGLPANCRMNPTPEDATVMNPSQYTGVPSDVVAFAMFMRLLAPPTPSTTILRWHAIHRQRQPQLQCDRLRYVPYADSPDYGLRFHARLEPSERQSILRLARPSHGYKSSRWSLARRCRPRPVPLRTPVGARSADFLAPRWPHYGSS